MSPISVYIDTNCINARQKDHSINDLENLFREQKILIEKTDTLDTELQEGYIKGLKKSNNYIESFGGAVWGHSGWDHSQWADDADERRLTRILKILWGQKNRSYYSKSEIRDAMHIATAARYGDTYFITNEKALLKHHNVIYSEFSIRILNPRDCLDAVLKRLVILEN